LDVKPVRDFRLEGEPDGCAGLRALGFDDRRERHPGRLGRLTSFGRPCEQRENGQKQP